MRKFAAAMSIVGVLGASYLSAAVYANVNGQDITDEDLAVILRAMPGATYGALPKDVQKKVLDQAIDRILLTDTAKKSGVESNSLYKEQLTKLKDDLALEVWMKEQFDATKVSESEIKKFYDDNKDKFKQPEIVRARHILVKDKKGATDIIAELIKTPEGKKIEVFEQLSTKYSIDKAAAQSGGELGWFDKNQMVPEFTKAAFGLKAGEITKEPVQTQFGYHVIMVEEKKPEQTLSYADVKERIEQQLKVEKFREEIAKKAESLRKSAKIKYDN